MRVTARRRRLDRELIQVGLELRVGGLVHGRSGNLSARDRGARMRITAAGARLGDLRRADLVWSGAGSDAGTRPLPSSEVALHAAVYERRPDVGAIVHTHSPYATAWASAATGLELDLEEAGYYRMGTRVSVAPHAPAGSRRLATSVVEHLAGGAAVLLERHGAVAVGADARRALDIAEALEHQAQVRWILEGRQAGRDPRLPPPVEVRRPGSGPRTPHSPTRR